MRPFYHRIIRAHISLVDQGKPPTFANIAREIGRSRQAVWEVFQRHPDLREWIESRMDREARQLTGSVVRRVGMLAIQGSDKHAEIYLRFCAGGYRLADPESVPAGQGLAPGSVVLNLLVPVPEMPKLAGAALTAAAAITPLEPRIPVVEVR